MGSFEVLKREQLEASIRRVREMSEVGVPAQGWIRTVREALGMSIRQLAERVGLSKSAVAALERREARGGISLDSLQKIADGLESDLRYAIVPRGTIEELRKARAREVAERVVATLGARMDFEMREVGEEELRILVEEHTRRALEASHKLWDD